MTDRNIIFKINQSPAGNSLCGRCSYGFIMSGEGKEYIRCQYIGRDITFHVDQCNRFYNRCQPPLELMLRDAWLIGGEDRKQFGFGSTEKWSKGDERQLAKELGISGPPV